MDFGLFPEQKISVSFELEYAEFGKLIPGIPLPEKSQKEFGLVSATGREGSSP